MGVHIPENNSSQIQDIVMNDIESSINPLEPSQLSIDENITNYDSIEENEQQYQIYGNNNNDINGIQTSTSNAAADVRNFFHSALANSVIPSNINKYYELFTENGFDTINSMKAVTMSDLVAMGVDKLGHRRSILHEFDSTSNVNNITSAVQSAMKPVVDSLKIHFNESIAKLKNNKENTPKDIRSMFKKQCKHTKQMDSLQQQKTLYDQSRDIQEMLKILGGYITMTPKEDKMNFKCEIGEAAGFNNKLASTGIECTKQDIWLWSIRFRKLKQTIWDHHVSSIHSDACNEVQRNPSVKKLLFVKRGRIFLRNLLFGGSDKRCVRDMHCQIDNGMYLGEDGLRSTHQVGIYKDIMYQQCMHRAKELMAEPYLFGGPRCGASSLDKRSEMNTSLTIHHVWTVLRGEMKAVPMRFTPVKAVKGFTSSGEDLSDSHIGAFDHVGLNVESFLLVTCGDGEFLKKHMEEHMRGKCALKKYFGVEWCPIHQILIAIRESKAYEVGFFLKGYNMSMKYIQKKIKTQYQQTALEKKCQEMNIEFESTKNYQATRFSAFNRMVSQSVNHTYPAISSVLEKVDPKGALKVIKSFAFVCDNNFSIDHGFYLQLFQLIWQKDVEFTCVQFKAIFEWRNNIIAMKQQFELLIKNPNHMFCPILLPYLSHAQSQLYEMTFAGVQLNELDYMDGDTLDFANMLDPSVAYEAVDLELWFNKMQKASKTQHCVCSCGAIFQNNITNKWIECIECLRLVCENCTKLITDHDEFICEECKKGKSNSDNTEEDEQIKELVHDAVNIIMTRSKTNAMRHRNVKKIETRNNLSRGKQLFIQRMPRYVMYLELLLQLFFDDDTGILKEARWKKYLPFYCQNIFDVAFIIKSIRELHESAAKKSRLFVDSYCKKYENEYNEMYTFISEQDLEIVPLLPNKEQIWIEFVRLLNHIHDICLSNLKLNEFEIIKIIYTTPKYVVRCEGILKIHNVMWCTKIMESTSEKLLKIMAIHFNKTRNRLKDYKLNAECMIHALAPLQTKEEAIFLTEFSSVCVGMGLQCMNVDPRSRQAMETHNTMGRKNIHALPFDGNTNKYSVNSIIKSIKHNQNVRKKNKSKTTTTNAINVHQSLKMIQKRKKKQLKQSKKNKKQNKKNSTKNKQINKTTKKKARKTESKTKETTHSDITSFFTTADERRAQKAELRHCNIQSKNKLILQPMEAIFKWIENRVLNNKYITAQQKNVILNSSTMINDDIAATLHQHFMKNIFNSLSFNKNGILDCAKITANTLQFFSFDFVNSLNNYKGNNPSTLTIKIMSRTFHSGMKCSLMKDNKYCIQLFKLYIKQVTYIYSKGFPLANAQHIEAAFNAWTPVHKELNTFKSVRKVVEICFECGRVNDQYDNVDEQIIKIHHVVKDMKNMASGYYWKATQQCANPTCNKYGVLSTFRRDISNENILVLHHFTTTNVTIENWKNDLQIVGLNGQINVYQILLLGMYMEGSKNAVGHYKSMKHIGNRNWIQFESLSPHKIYKVPEYQIKKLAVSSVLIRKKKTMNNNSQLRIDIPLMGSNVEVKNAYQNHINLAEDEDVDFTVDDMRAELLSVCLNNIKTTILSKQKSAVDLTSDSE
eukprot:274541_1